MEYTFLTWADVHHDELGAKCVTLNDTIKVERDLFQRARDIKCDFTLFPGDRYLKREPRDEVKVMADRVMYDFVHKGSIPHYHLIGNHDWTDNTRRWHTAESLKWMNNVIIMDEAKTYGQDNVRIHALPADFEFDMSKYEVDPDCLNLFVFHDTVRGSWMNEEGTMKFDSGIELSAIDLPQWDFVIAGDIHIRQKFKLKNTHGGYLGSVVQRTRIDSNKSRGWTEMKAVKEPNRWSFQVNFVPTKNLFTRIQYGVDDKSTFEGLTFDASLFEDQFVEVKLSGDKINVDRIADDPGWKKLEKKLKPRKIEKLRAYETQQSNVVVDLTSSNGVMDDLSLYLESGFASLGALKSEVVTEAVNQLKNQEA